VEFVPTTIHLFEKFLTAIEVTPANGTESPHEQVQGTGFHGSQIGDAICVFADADADAFGTVVLPAAASPQTYRLLVTNVAKNAARTFSGGANIVGLLRASDGDDALAGGATSSAQGTIEVVVSVDDGSTDAARTLTID
jgi:hypothetical protein